MKNDKYNIWIANGVDFIRFADSLNKEIKEITEKLSYYDRILLNKLAIALKNRQNTLVTKLFI